MMKSSLVCAYCGGEFPRGQLRYARLDPAGRDANGEPLSPEHCYCSERCLSLGTLRDGLKPRCATCGNSIGRVEGPGRPASYCSDKCKRSRERLLGRAMRDLAKDRVPGRAPFKTARGWLDDLSRALDEANDLARFWDGERGSGPATPVSPRARQALRRRIAVLSAERDRALAETGAEAARAGEERAGAAWNDEVEAEHAAEQAWRAELGGVE